MMANLLEFEDDGCDERQQEHAEPDQFDPGLGAQGPLLGEHVDADVAVGLEAEAEAEQEADPVDVPLQLFERDRADAEQVAEHDLGDDDEDEHQPQPRRGFAEPGDHLADGDGERRRRHRGGRGKLGRRELGVAIGDTHGNKAVVITLERYSVWSPRGR